MHGRYSVLAHYLKVSLKNSRFLKIPKLHPQKPVRFTVDILLIYIIDFIFYIYNLDNGEAQQSQQGK